MDPSGLLPGAPKAPLLLDDELKNKMKTKQTFSKGMMEKGKKEKLITDRLAFEDDESIQRYINPAFGEGEDKKKKKLKQKGGKEKQKGGSVIGKSRQTRSGLLFPVNRIQNMLKAKVAANSRVAATAAVYMAAVLEYLVAELCELSGNRSKVGNKAVLDQQGQNTNPEFTKKRARITPQFLNYAIREDKEFNDLLKRVTVAGGGVLPKSDKQLRSIFPALKKAPKKPEAFDEEEGEEADGSDFDMQGSDEEESKVSKFPGKGSKMELDDMELDDSPVASAVMGARINKFKNSM